MVFKRRRRQNDRGLGGHGNAAAHNYLDVPAARDNDQQDGQKLSTWVLYQSLRSQEPETAASHYMPRRLTPPQATATCASEPPTTVEQHLDDQIETSRDRQDYYLLLGLSYDASRAEIERAYRQYVVRIHPDKYFNDALRHESAQLQLKEVNGAMQVLRDPERRARYNARLGGLSLASRMGLAL